MPCYTYQQFLDAAREGGSFQPKRAREVAKELRGFFTKAAESLEKKEETKALAASLREYEQALKTVSAKFDPRRKNEITQGLKTLDGFKDFLEQESPSGASNYELLAGELKTLGEDVETFRSDIGFVSATLDMEIEVDELEKEARRRAARAKAQPPKDRQPPQAQPQQPAPPGGVQQNAPGGGRPAGPRPPAAKEPPAAGQKPETEEEYLRTEGALSINELLENPVPRPGPAEDELPEPETAAFKEIKVPGNPAPTVGEAFERFCRDQRFYSMQDRFTTTSGTGIVAMAVDEKGKAYKSVEEIKTELAKPGRRLFVFHKDGSLPHALENRGGRLFASDGEISVANQLPGHELYAPKRSLKAEDMAEIPSYKGVKSTEEHAKDLKLSLKSVDARITEVNDEITENRKWIDQGEFDYTNLNRPKRPTGVGTWIWRAAVKIATLGFGETAAFKEYKQQKKSYDRNIAEAPKKAQKLKEELKRLQEKRKSYNRDLAAYSKENAKLQTAYDAARPEEKKKEIQAYRKRTEVRMEAVADIIRGGAVTPDNIFANTWLKKAACEGKPKTDPEALRALKEYVVSRTVEEEVLTQTMEDKEYSRARNERMVGGLNNGSWMQRLEKDGVFREVLEQQGNKPIDPEKIYEEYTARARERDAQRNHPLTRLQTEREALIRDFGQKPVTQDALKDVTRLLMLDAAIGDAEKLPKDPRQVSKEQSRESAKALASIYKNRDVSEHMTKTRREAIAQLSADPANAGKTFTLDQLAGMVDTASKQLEQQKQTERNQGAPIV